MWWQLRATCGRSIERFLNQRSLRSALSDKSTSLLLTSHTQQKNNRLVFNASQRIVAELIEDVWGDKNNVTVEQTLDTTIRVRYRQNHLPKFKDRK